MGRGDFPRRGAWAWLLATAPVALWAGEPETRPAAAPVEQGLLEFLAEEPALDEELGKALMSGELDREIDRAARRDKVKEDATQPQ